MIPDFIFFLPLCVPPTLLSLALSLSAVIVASPDFFRETQKTHRDSSRAQRERVTALCGAVINHKFIDPFSFFCRCTIYNIYIYHMAYIYVYIYACLDLSRYFLFLDVLSHKNITLFSPVFPTNELLIIKVCKHRLRHQNHCCPRAIVAVRSSAATELPLLQPHAWQLSHHKYISPQPYPNANPPILPRWWQGIKLVGPMLSFDTI